jgi:hypothetical protein
MIADEHVNRGSTPCGGVVLVGAMLLGMVPEASGEESAATRIYRHELRLVEHPEPILGDYPEYVAKIEEVPEGRFEAPPLVDDESADLEVRCWRFSYNARGIIEMTNRLEGSKTAVVVVHPWGVDDGSGWITPEPAGAAFQCTPRKNRLITKHLAEVVNPLLKRLRPRVGLVSYSLPGKEDSIRGKVYRSVRSTTDAKRRAEGEVELASKLGSFDYTGAALPMQIELKERVESVDYFAAVPGLAAYEPYNRNGYWQLPTPVHRAIDVDLADVVFYDGEGYEILRTFLQSQGVRHVLLAGYNTDMCVCSTTAGYENLRKDFNVFLIGDATIATFPGQSSPAHATNAAVAFASLKVFITQDHWIREIANRAAR